MLLPPRAELCYAREQVEAATESSACVVGRESEFALLVGFLSKDDGPRALLITGEAGIGKTTLWEAGIAAARERGFRVLVARPSESEVQLSFVALADLLEEVGAAALASVPPPQLRALEVALLRVDPGGEPPEPVAVSSGFTGALRILADGQPLVVAVDDVPWLDRSSADALVFAARRLAGRRVRFLLARRSGEPSRLEPAFGPLGLERMEVGPLSLGATRALLFDRLGLTAPRRVLLRLFDASQGNPLFALELGRLLVERGASNIDAELPVPDLVDDLFGERIADLAGSIRRALLAVALTGGLSWVELAAIVDPMTLAEAVDAGLLIVDGDRVRPAHPLLAAVARSSSPARERRALHLDLARTVSDERLQARHLALATESPEAEVAGAVAAAAASASARGAAYDAVELAEHALRLTPAEANERPERVLVLGQYLAMANEPPRVIELLTERLAELPAGAARGRAYLLLADMAEDCWDMQDYLDRALAASDDTAVRASALAMKAGFLAVVRVERVCEAEAAALEAGRLGGAEAEPVVPYALAWTRILRGRSIDDLRDDVSPVGWIFFSLDRLRAIRLAFRGQLEARAIFAKLLSLADERGEAVAYAMLQRHLCELELRAGELAAAARILDEWEPVQTDVVATRKRCEALLAASRGLVDEAERAASSAIAASEAGMRWNLLEGLRARGIAALLAREPKRAVESLRTVWEHTRREGVDDPGAFPVAPDLVEALVDVGELEEAEAVTEHLQALSEEQGHPWGLASAKRCRGLIRLASGGYDEQAVAMLAEAADAYRALGLRFDESRSLLALGRMQRRCRKWAAARRSLERAAAVFDEMGSPGWADQARSDLARVGARRPTPEGALSQTEERVARLAANGLSNKQIAAELFVTVHTVEKHLSHVYEKLAIRSRGQLVRFLA